MQVRIPIAAALLVRDGRLLLGHRHPSRRWYPDCWDLIGGHIEPGEKPAAAVIRECREELGITVLDPKPFPIALSDPTLMMYAFVVTQWEGEPVNAEPTEHDELRWFMPGELTGLTLADPAGVPGILRAVARVAGRST